MRGDGTSTERLIRTLEELGHKVTRISPSEVWVFDSWDETAQESIVQVFAGKKAALKYADKWERKRIEHVLYSGVVKRKVRA